MTVRSKYEAALALFAGQLFLFPKFNSKMLRIYGKVKVRGDKSRLKIGRSVVFRGDATIVLGYGDLVETITLSDGVVVEDGAYLNSHGGSIFVGENSFIGVRCVLQGKGGVELGDNVLLGPHVQIFSSDHSVDPAAIPRSDIQETYNPVIVGSNVWLAAGCILLSSTRIPDNSVVGAGCVVRTAVSEPGLYVDVREFSMKRRFE